MWRCVGNHGNSRDEGLSLGMVKKSLPVYIFVIKIYDGYQMNIYNENPR